MQFDDLGGAAHHRPAKAASTVHFCKHDGRHDGRHDGKILQTETPYPMAEVHT